MNFFSYKQGLTLIEILISLGIFLLIAGTLSISFLNLNNKEVLDKERLNLKTLLEEARSLTLSSKSDTEWGVHIESNQYILFKGSTYTQGASGNKLIEIHSKVSINSVNLNGGGSDVVFDRLTGGTSQYGTVVFSLTNEPSAQKIVSIGATGIIE